jgi:TetR/AcrR family transcriptional regulator
MKITGLNAGPAAKKRFSAEARHKQLLQIAIELFSQRGFEGTTTKAIAAAAGVSEGIIFQHFATKEDLYAGILDYKAKEAGMEEWQEQLRDCAEREDDEGLVLSIVEQILRSNRLDPQFQRLMCQAALNGHPLPKIMAQRILPLRNFLCGYIAQRQKKGALRSCDPGVAVHAIVSMPNYYGLAKSLFGVDVLRLPEHELALSFTRLILGGLQVQDVRRKGKKNAAPKIR